MTRPTIDELEMLNPFELGELLIAEIEKFSPDVQHIQDLIAVGCPIDARDEWGRTALHWASNGDHLEVVEFLISKGADINARSNTGRTALHWATNDGMIKVAEFLVQEGADIYARDNVGNTPWNLASTLTKKSCPELKP